MSDPAAPPAHAARTGAAAQDGPGGPAAGRASAPRPMTPLPLGPLLNPVNSTMSATSLVAIGQDFRVGAAATAWLISAMHLAGAVGRPSMGRLADRAGVVLGLLLLASTLADRTLRARHQP